MIAWAEGMYTSGDNTHAALATDAKARGYVEALSELIVKMEDINRVDEPTQENQTDPEESADGVFVIED